MSLLSFPDVNVWFALLCVNHVHREAALHWWESTPSEVIGMGRLAQLGALRLMTTSAAMGGKPLTMQEAWDAYYALFRDGRLAFFPEPAGVEKAFEALTRSTQSSPKAWADAYLLAFARCHNGELVTFDQALSRHPNCHVIAKA